MHVLNEIDWDMLIKYSLNTLATWMISESQVMARAHLHHGSPLPPEADRIVAGNGDTPFSALLNCSTPYPQRSSLHPTPCNSPHSFIHFFISLSCFPVLLPVHIHTLQRN